MNETETELFITIKEQLGQLNANMSQCLARLTEHELRLRELETRKEDGDLKSELLRLLAKAVVIGATAVGSLCGAGKLL